MISENTPIKDVLAHLENRLATNQVKDSVHKIKLMTARDVIKEICKI